MIGIPLIGIPMNMKDMLDLENSIGLLVKMAGKSFEKALDIELREKCGLTAGRWKIIIILAFQDGQSQKDISDAISVDGSTLVPIIDKMESEGFVIRKPNPEDRRNNKIFLTSKSQDSIEPIVKCILDIRKIATSKISEARLATTKKVLKEMTSNADFYIKKKSIQKITSTIKRKRRSR